MILNVESNYPQHPRHFVCVCTVHLLHLKWIKILCNSFSFCARHSIFQKAEGGSVPPVESPMDATQDREGHRMYMPSTILPQTKRIFIHPIEAVKYVEVGLLCAN